MESIAVSIIIPYYHSSKTMRHAIHSVLKQKLSGVSDGADKGAAEIIIVDASDNFNDKLIKGLDNPYGYDIKLIGGGAEMDAASARNLGVENSRGEYIAFLDADDWWEEDKLRKQLDVFKNDEEAKLVFTARRLCNENGHKSKKVIPAPDKVAYKELCHSNYISCSSVVMRRETALKYPMKSGDIHEDYLCWLEMFGDGGYAVGINKPLLNYRSYRSSRSGKKLGSALMTYRTYKAAGFGFIKRLVCMIRYAFNGLKKYL